MYFKLIQDERIQNYVKLSFSYLEIKSMWKEDSPKFIPVNNSKKHIYLPFYDCKILIINEKVKNIFDEYQTDITYRNVVFSDMKNKEMNVYYFIKPPEIDCLSEKTKLINNIYIKDICLKKEKIKSNNIFTVKGANYNDLIISLEVVEKLLRNGINEFSFSNIQIDEEEIHV